MLNVILYSLKDPAFKSYGANKEQSQALVIVANPEKSDRARAQLIELNLAEKIQTTTISKFTKDFLNTLDIQYELAQKAEILKSLSYGWMKTHGEIGFNRFLTAYNIFSELRGFSTQLETVEEILESLDSDLRQGVKVLWQLFDLYVFDQLKMLDEHQAYQVISRACLSHETEFFENTWPRKLIFYGFDHLSGTQIDLLNSLRLHFDVDVLYSEELFTQKKNTDWISWLTRDLNLDVLNKNNEYSTIEVNVFSFPRMRLAELEYDFHHRSIVLASSDMSPALIMQLPLNDAYYSFEIDPFEGFIKFIRDELLDYENKSISDVIHYFELNDIRLKKEKSFKEIKVIELYKNFFNELLLPTGHSGKLSFFLIELAEHIVSLNTPRVQMQTLECQSASTKVYSLNDYLNDEVQKPIMVALAAHSNLNASTALLSKEVELKLSSLGPLFNKQHFYLSLKAKIQNELSLGNLTLLLEEGVLDNDASWKEIFSDFKNVKIDLIHKENRELKDETNKRKEGMGIDISSVTTKPTLPLSFSAFQEFYDCPRKYALKFLEKRSPMIELDHTLVSAHLGELQHAVIETYCDKSQNVNMDLVFNEQRHNKIVTEKLTAFAAKKNIYLSSDEYEKAYLEILALSESGIRFILGLMTHGEFLDIKFEQPFQDKILKGRIDAILFFTWGNFIIDFKRSSSSVPSHKDLLSFDKIQMPIYLSHGIVKANGFAYLNLSEIEDSIALLDLVAQESLSAHLSQIRVKAHEIEPWLEAYLKLENDYLTRLENENHFYPKPRNIKVCEYCMIKNVCPRTYA